MLMSRAEASKENERNHDVGDKSDMRTFIVCVRMLVSFL